MAAQIRISHSITYLRDFPLLYLLAVIVIPEAHHLSDLLLEHKSQLSVAHLFVGIQLFHKHRFVYLIGDFGRELCAAVQRDYPLGVFM